MSHITKIKVEIRDLEALQNACRRLGFQFLKDSRHYVWYNRFMGDYPLPDGITVDQLGQCDHEIKVPGAQYSIGVVQQGDKYTLLYDFWQYGGLKAALGDNAEKLVQAYAVEAAKLEAEHQGYSVYEEPQADGSIQLHIQVGV